MAGQEKSFQELLNDAPKAAETACLVGALSRSPEAGKFVLTMMDGRAVTLPTGAVRDYVVLTGGVGQLLVRIEVDQAQLPADAAAAMETDAGQIRSIVWTDHTLPGRDLKAPVLDTHPGVFPDIKIPYVDQYVAGPAPVYPGDPVTAGYAAMMPFALAMPHHAPAATIAAMQAPMLSRPVKHPWGDKRPQEDGTFPGHPPTNDF